MGHTDVRKISNKNSAYKNEYVLLYIWNIIGIHDSKSWIKTRIWRTILFKRGFIFQTYIRIKIAYNFKYTIRTNELKNLNCIWKLYLHIKLYDTILKQVKKKHKCNFMIFFM